MKSTWKCPEGHKIKLTVSQVEEVGTPFCPKCANAGKEDVEMELDDSKPVTTNDGFDNFLDDATHAVKDMWQDRKGRKLTLDELYDLNDALTAFFSDKKPVTNTCPECGRKMKKVMVPDAVGKGMHEELGCPKCSD